MQMHITQWNKFRVGKNTPLSTHHSTAQTWIKFIQEINKTQYSCGTEAYSTIGSAFP